MTVRSKLRGQKNEGASSFCPFAPVESLLVAKVSIGERRLCGNIDRVAAGKRSNRDYFTRKLSRKQMLIRHTVGFMYHDSDHSVYVFKLL